MDKMFQTLNDFLSSPSCIFNFNLLDYPTEYQQHLITNYFTMSELLSSELQLNIIKLLHTSDKYLDIFIPGLLYEMILDPKRAEEHFDTFMPSLRNQSWIHFGKLLLQLLQDSFLWIKQGRKRGIIPLLNKLAHYRQLNVDLVVLAVKTINYTDLSEHALNYSNQMVCFFHRLINQYKEQQYSSILAKTFFYKIFRVKSLLVCIEDRALQEYQKRLVTLAEELFQLEEKSCMAACNSGNKFVLEVSKSGLEPLCQKLMEASQNKEYRSQSAKSAALRLSSVLPLKIETTLLYIIKQGLSKKEVKLQLDWIFSAKGSYTIVLVLDMLRFVLAIPSEDLPVKQCLFILQWLFFRVCSNQILLELWKDELFYPCFAEPCPFPAAPERAIRFIGYLLELDLQFGQNLLIYLLHHYGRSHQTSLRNFLLKASELQFINLQTLINKSALRTRTKEELVSIVGHKSTSRSVMQTEQPHYYDPLESMNRRESEMSLQFSQSDNSMEYHQYSESNQAIIHQDPSTPKENSSLTARLKLEKMFVEDMGQALSILLASPSLENYKDFHKKFISVVKELKVSGEHQDIQNFITQCCKVTYLIFQNQFEEHANLPSREQNVIFFLLNVASGEWRSNSLLLQISKKVVKKIIELFPTSEASFWRHFLLNFKRSIIGHCKDMKDWLFPKQKAVYAITLLRQLGPLPRQLIENAELLRIPVVC